MKIICTLILTAIISLNCKAQSPIINLDGWDGEGIENAYYKDTSNFINPFEGTWVYTNGNTSFKIVLIKETMLYTGKFYVDYLSGEYQYIENGVEKANTLNNTDPYAQGIGGNSLVKSTSRPPCSDCPANERRVRLSISDRVRGLSGSFTLKLTTVNGQPALEGLIWGNGVGVYHEDDPPPFFEMIIPTGTFAFIKQ